MMVVDGRTCSPSLNMCIKNSSPQAPLKSSKHPTYRNYSEDSIDDTCTNGGIDWLLNTCIFKDSC